MELSRYSLAITITGTLTVLAASMLVWLLLTEPVALATAVGDHDLTALAQAVGHALAATFKAIVQVSLGARGAQGAWVRKVPA